MVPTARYPHRFTKPRLFFFDRKFRSLGGEKLFRVFSFDVGVLIRSSLKCLRAVMARVQVDSGVTGCVFLFHKWSGILKILQYRPWIASLTFKRKRVLNFLWQMLHSNNSEGWLSFMWTLSLSTVWNCFEQVGHSCPLPFCVWTRRICRCREFLFSSILPQISQVTLNASGSSCAFKWSFSADTVWYRLAQMWQTLSYRRSCLTLTWRLSKLLSANLK